MTPLVSCLSIFVLLCIVDIILVRRKKHREAEDAFLDTLEQSHQPHTFEEELATLVEPIVEAESMIAMPTPTALSERVESALAASAATSAPPITLPEESKPIPFWIPPLLTLIVLSLNITWYVLRFSGEPLNDYIEAILRSPLLVGYIIYSTMVIRRQRYEVDRQLITLLDAEAGRRFLIQNQPIDKRWYWIVAIALGAIGARATGNWGATDLTPEIVRASSVFILLTIASQSILTVLADCSFVGKLVSASHLENLLDNAPYHRVTQWSSRIFRTFIGGLTMSILFMTNTYLFENQAVFAIHIIVLIVAVLIYFSSILNTHRALRRTKRQQLVQIDEQLIPARQTYLASGNDPQNERLAQSVQNLQSYREMVQGASEWSHTVGDLWSFITFFLLPLILIGLRATN